MSGAGINLATDRARARSEGSLCGRVVLVTGGSGLLGSRYLRGLAAAGAAPVNLDLRAGGDAATAGAAFFETDLTDRGSVDSAVRAAFERFGRIDALVNNAAIDPKFDAGADELHTLPFERYPIEAFRASVETNLLGTIAVTQAVGKMLIEQGVGGCVVNICSTYGLVSPDPGLYAEGTFKPADYCVTKAGLLQLTRYLAVHWAPHGIRVNCLTPGGVRNEQPDVFRARYAARTPMARMAEADEMVGPLRFLLSDESSYMTGQNLVIDGGWTAW